MNAEAILRSRSLGSVALGLTALLVAVGVGQGATRAMDADSTVLGPLAVAVLCVTAVLLAGRTLAGWRRTPYW
ncbi:hypothetical protein [Salinarchaeum chitinilyticum]